MAKQKMNLSKKDWDNFHQHYNSLLYMQKYYPNIIDFDNLPATFDEDLKSAEIIHNTFIKIRGIKNAVKSNLK